MFNFTHSHAYSTSVPLNDGQLSRVSHFLKDNQKEHHPGRINEFLAGRYCAVLACEKLGVNLGRLDQGDKRNPLWPKGVVGSISHTKDLAVAVVASESQVKAIGVDVENIVDHKKIAALESLVLLPEELTYLGQFPTEKRLELLTLVFSIKEAFYKALFPLVQTYFGFHEAKVVEIDLVKGLIRLECHSEMEALTKHKGVYQGEFHFDHGKVFSAFEIF